VEFGTEHRIYHFDDRSGYGGRILVTDGAATGYVVPLEERCLPEQPGTKANPADEIAVGETQFNYLHKKIFALPERMYIEAGHEPAEKYRTYVAEFAE